MLNRKMNSITKVKKEVVPFYGGSSRERKISLSARPNKDEVKMVHDQLKNEDIKLKSKRQLMRVMRHSSPASYNQEKELSDQMVRNMERKLELLSSL